MAKPEVCKIDGCGKAVSRRGLCNAHYMRRKRHGNPLGGGRAPGESTRYFEETVLHFDSDECLVWPYNRGGDGYGRLWRGGRAHVVSRLVCEAFNGPPPSADFDAAHSCGNGRLGCVNGRHLSWKTRAENIADTVAHGNTMRGERNVLAKLTEDQVLEIRRLKGSATQVDLAKRFGVSRQTIASIHAGQNWGWL